MIVIMYPVFFKAEIILWPEAIEVIFLTCSNSIFLPQILCLRRKIVNFWQSYNLSVHGQRTSGGKLIKIASMLPPVFNPNSVPRSCNRLNST